MKNILPHIVNYEKTTLDKNIIWDVQHDVRQISKNLQILRSKKAYGLKISQSIIFICFSLPWKILYKYKAKQIIELAKTLWLFA